MRVYQHPATPLLARKKRFEANLYLHLSESTGWTNKFWKCTEQISKVFWWHSCLKVFNCEGIQFWRYSILIVFTSEGIQFWRHSILNVFYSENIRFEGIQFWILKVFDSEGTWFWRYLILKKYIWFIWRHLILKVFKLEKKLGQKLCSHSYLMQNFLGHPVMKVSKRDGGATDIITTVAPLKASAALESKPNLSRKQ